MAPIDQDGNICGYTGETADTTGYKKLYIANIKAAGTNPANTFAYGVCVSKCPEGKDLNATCAPAY